MAGPTQDSCHGVAQTRWMHNGRASGGCSNLRIMRTRISQRVLCARKYRVSRPLMTCRQGYERAACFTMARISASVCAHGRGFAR